MNKKILAAAAVIAIALLTVTIVYAASILVESNHVIGTPLEPIPSATPTPSPTPQPVIIGATLIANDTDAFGAYVFFRGDTIRLTATLNVTQAGVNVQLYNNGNLVTNALSDSFGVVVFERTVNNPYDYCVKVENII